MRIEISHDDKMAFITDFMSKLPGHQQVEIMEQAAAELPIERQADIVYDFIKSIVERNNPGLRSEQSKQDVADALGRVQKTEEGG